MLTPQQITQMNGITGLNKPATPTQAAGQTRAQQILALGKSAQPSPLAGFAGAVGGSMLDTAKAGVQNVASGFSDVFSKPQMDANAVSEAAKGGGIGAGVAEAGAQALKAGEHAVAGVGKIVGGTLQVGTSPVLGPATKLGSVIGQKLADQIPTDAAQKFENFLEAHPEIGSNSTDIMNLANLAFPDVVKTAAPAVDATLAKGSAVASKVKDAVTPTPEAPEAVAARTAETAKATALKASDTIEKEIRNTAEKYPSVGDALNKAEVTKGSDPIKVISSYPGGKALPIMNKAGKMNSIPAINFLKNQVGQLGKIKENLVKTATENVSIDDFKQAALDRIDKSGSSVTKANADKADVAKIIDKMKSDYPDGIPNSELDKIKTEQAGESKSYKSKSPFSPDAHATVGQTAADAVASKPGGDIVDELNKLMTSHYDAIKLLKTMSGKTPHGGVLSRHASNIVGEVGGLAGGLALGHPFLGAMVGRGASEFVQNVLNSHFISNPLKRTLITNMKGEKPEVIQQALDYLDKTSGDATSGDTTVPSAETPATEAVSSESSTNSSTQEQPIGDKLTPPTTNVQKPLNSGFVKLPGGKIPQEALRTMSDFTDYVAGSYKLTGEAALSMEQEAADLYDTHIGGKAPKTLQGLANAFGKVLEKNNFLKDQGRDASGRFTNK